MSPTLDNNGSIITEHKMSQIVVTTITWFVLVSLFLPQAEICTDHPWHIQLGPGRPRLHKLVLVGPHLLKLVLAGCCLLNLVQAGRLVVGGSSSGAALVRDGCDHDRYRHGCSSSLVRCGRGAGQECPFSFLCRLECCTLPSEKAMFVSQAHLISALRFCTCLSLCSPPR